MTGPHLAQVQPSRWRDRPNDRDTQEDSGKQLAVIATEGSGAGACAGESEVTVQLAEQAGSWRDGSIGPGLP